MSVSPAATPLMPVADPSSLGRIRRLDRCATEDGFLAVAAIDHPAKMLATSGVEPPPFEEAAALKLVMIRALARHASGLLLDPELSIGQATLTGDLPGGVGMIANIERLRETPEGFERTVDLRPGWSPEKAAQAGADGVKFVFFHRAESTESATADEQRVRTLVDACHAVGLPCIIEPLWYPLDGEDPDDARVASARARGIIAAAVRFAALGADVLKVQFPGNVESVEARAGARQAARELDEALDVPWVLLSDAVAYNSFLVQLELAAGAGASGFMAGRAVWSGAVHSGADPAAVATAGERLASLVEVLRANGRPWRERLVIDQVSDTLARTWWSAGP